MPVLLGGDKSWKQRVVGDVVVTYQWVNQEPAMVLFPKFKKDNAGAFVLCLSAAHNYVHSDGYADVDYLIPQSLAAARVMRMDENISTIKRIADAIVDGIDDLLKMPPEPVGMNEKKAEEIGEAIIKVDGKTILETPLTDLSVAEMAANGVH